MLHVALVVVPRCCVLENGSTRAGNIFPRACALRLNCVETGIGSWTRHFWTLDFILHVVEAGLGCIEARLGHVLWQQHVVTAVLPLSCRVARLCIGLTTFIEKAEGGSIFVSAGLNRGSHCVLSLTHCLARLVGWPIEVGVTIFGSIDSLVERGWAVTLDSWLENGVRLQFLHFLVQFNRLLEGKSLFHDLLVLDGDHTIVHVSGHLVLFRLLLVLESWVSSAKWIHLVSLAHLEAQSSHLVFHQLVVQVGTRTRVLSDLLWYTLEELTLYSRLIWWLRLALVVLVDWHFIQLLTALLIDETLRALQLVCLGLSGWIGEILAHLMLMWHVVMGRRVFHTSWVLEWWNWYVSVEERVALSHGSKLSIYGALHDVRRFPTVVVLGPRVDHSVQISVWAETVSLGVENVLTLWAYLHISKIFHGESLFVRRMLDWLGYCFNRRGRSIEQADFFKLTLDCLLLVRLFFVFFTHEFETWRKVLCHVYFGLIITRAEFQLLLSVEDVVCIFLLVHFSDVNLHQLVSLHCLAKIQLAMIFWWRFLFIWVQNLVIELDLVLESLSAAIQHFYPFLFCPVDRHFGLFRLKCPALLVVYQRLVHLLLPSYWCHWRGH